MRRGRKVLPDKGNLKEKKLQRLLQMSHVSQDRLKQSTFSVAIAYNNVITIIIMSNILLM